MSSTSSGIGDAVHAGQPRGVGHAAPRGRWSVPIAPATGCADRPGSRPSPPCARRRPRTRRPATPRPAAQRLDRTTGFPSSSQRPIAGTAPGREVAAAEGLDHHAVVRGRARRRASRRRSPTTIGTSATRAPSARGLERRSAAPAGRRTRPTSVTCRARAPNGAPKASSATVFTFTASRPCQIRPLNTTCVPRPAARLRSPPPDRIRQVPAAVPLGVVAGAHGAGAHDRRVAVERAIEQVRRLLQRIGAMRDDDSLHRRVVRSARAPARAARQ